MADASIDTNTVDSNDTNVGEILSRTRQHYGQSIEEVERALRIRACQIEAIEAGDLEALPGRVYGIGFVRSYAEYLGLDGEKMVTLFKQQTAGQAPVTEHHFPIAASDGQLPAWWLLALCVFGTFLILSLWLSSSREGREVVDNIPTVAEGVSAGLALEEPKAPEDRMNASVDVVEDEVVIEEKPAEGIILNIRQNSWVEIRDQNGKAMLSRVLKAGDQYYVPDRPDLTISIGNAGGVEIEVDGQPLRKLGEQGKVLRRLSLDAEYLKENFALEHAQ